MMVVIDSKNSKANFKSSFQLQPGVNGGQISGVSSIKETRPSRPTMNPDIIKAIYVITRLFSHYDGRTNRWTHPRIEI